MDRAKALPTITFIGGTTKDIDLDVYNKYEQVELAGLSATLLVSDYVNFGGPPIFTQDGERTIEKDREYFHFCLSAEDTLNWRGKYIYQITLRDEPGKTAVYQGFLEIHGNADRFN